MPTERVCLTLGGRCRRRRWPERHSSAPSCEPGAASGQAEGNCDVRADEEDQAPRPDAVEMILLIAQTFCVSVPIRGDASLMLKVPPTRVVSDSRYEIRFASSAWLIARARWLCSRWIDAYAMIADSAEATYRVPWLPAPKTIVIRNAWAVRPRAGTCQSSDV